jgi:hypothetical protein
LKPDSIPCFIQLRDLRQEVVDATRYQEEQRLGIARNEEKLFALYQSNNNDELTFDQYKQRIKEMMNYEI